MRGARAVGAGQQRGPGGREMHLMVSSDGIVSAATTTAMAPASEISLQPRLIAKILWKKLHLRVRIRVWLRRPSAKARKPASPMELLDRLPFVHTVNYVQIESRANSEFGLT